MPSTWGQKTKLTKLHQPDTHRYGTHTHTAKTCRRHQDAGGFKQPLGPIDTAHASRRAKLPGPGLAYACFWDVLRMTPQGPHSGWVWGRTIIMS